MFTDILREISRSHWIDIILALKKSEGLSVKEISTHLGMSYMGIKQHCLKMQSLGYLDTWRKPQKTGRPLLCYRLTKKCDLLFPSIGEELGLSILNSLADSHGKNAPEKHLNRFFSDKADFYINKLKNTKSITDRAEKFCQIRTSEGYTSECHYSQESGLHIIEYHSLLESLEEHYPTVAKMEEQMIAKVLKNPVSRSIEKFSAIEKRIYRIKTL